MAAEGEERYTFFWRAESPFSQWHASVFTVDGTQYSCAEQYMMHQKAELFKDAEIASAVMSSTSPKQMKALGRQVRNFDEDKWNANCKDIVKKGSMAKFTQNDHLRAQLLQTGDTVLVEASPYDRKWGIGLAADDPAASHKRAWKGKNWLGYILTQVRDEIANAK